MDSIAFTGGLAGISHVSSEQTSKDFPKNKSAFKPSGEHVIAYTWRALEFSRTFAHRELRFAINLPSNAASFSPDEHHMMMDKALMVLAHHLDKGPAITKALAVLKESQRLQKALYMSRNVLHAG